jgi:uncharacterized protein with GYD domain
MVHAMVQFSYAGEAVQKLIKNPEDRTKGLKALIENLGGKLHAFYYTFGEYDGFAIVELPDNVSTLAASMASGNPATVSKIKTTIIITMQEAMEAMKKAKGLSIKPPKG